MTLKEIRSIAQKMGVPFSSKSKTEMIHAIQKAENNEQCFKKNISCDQINCLWRKDCLPKIH